MIAGNAFAAVGAASLLWPFIQQMNPDASAKALASIEIDLSPVKEGQAITRHVARQADLHPQPHQGGDRVGRERRPENLPDAEARNDDLPTDEPAPTRTASRRAMRTG